MDITIVCGRRPDLLRLTLDSFCDRIIRHFPVGTVYANIDPFCGTVAHGDACEALLRDRFDRVNIRRPALASFGAAVKHLWQQPTTPYFLHMEDDWDVLHHVTPDQIEERLKGRVTQVQLAARDRTYLPLTYAYRATWRTVLGLKVMKRVHLDRPIFSTSPSFIRTDFASQCAAMMDPAKDPEKQLFAEDTALSTFTKDYLNHPLQGPNRSAIVRDLGRAWLAARGMQKRIVEGVSVWDNKGSEANSGS